MNHTTQKSQLNPQINSDSELPNELDYKKLFEQLDVAIWRLCISAIFSDLKEIRESGVTNISSYLNKSPEKVLEITMKVKIIQANSAALNLLEADSLNHLLENLHSTFTGETVQFFYKMICTNIELPMAS